MNSFTATFEETSEDGEVLKAIVTVKSLQDETIDVNLKFEPKMKVENPSTVAKIAAFFVEQLT